MNRVVVKRFEMPEKSTGGILLNNKSQESVVGEVVAVGKGQLNGKGEL